MDAPKFKKWIIPNEEDTGIIELAGSSEVLAPIFSSVPLMYRLPNNKTMFSPTTLQVMTFNNSDHQLWYRSKKSKSGFFTLKNVMSGKYLSRSKTTGNL